MEFTNLKVRGENEVAPSSSGVAVSSPHTAIVPSKTDIRIEPTTISSLDIATMYASLFVMGNASMAASKIPTIMLLPVLPVYSKGNSQAELYIQEPSSIEAYAS